MPRVLVTFSVQDMQHGLVAREAVAELVGVDDALSSSHSRDLTPRQLVASIRRRSAAADVFIAVLGPPTGQTHKRPPGRPEESEFLSSLTLEIGKPVFLFVHRKSLIDRPRYDQLLETYDTPEELRTGVVRALTTWMNKNAPDSFELKFSPLLTEEQVKASLFALADYFRACGGVGLDAEFDLEDILIKEPEGALV